MKRQGETRARAADGAEWSTQLFAAVQANITLVAAFAMIVISTVYLKATSAP